MTPPCCYLLKRFPQLTQTFVQSELRELERQGSKLAVIARSGPSGQRACDRSRHPLPGLRAPVHYLNGEVAAAHDEETADLVRQVGARHVHAHFAGWAAFAAMRVAAATGVGYSLTAHATDIYRAGVDQRALVDLMAGARFVVTVTEDNRRFLEQLLDTHGRAGRIVRLYNGVDLRRLQPAFADRDAALVVGAGRLVEKKGHDVLIEAVRLLRAQGRDVRCVIVGEGPLRPQLEQQIATAGLGSIVELVGARKHDEVLDLVRLAAVFALPSVVGADGDRDALPTVILEAMALGTPVLSTTVSGIPEMVTDGQSGLLVSPRDPVATAAALDQLLDDAALRRRVARVARVRVEQHFDLARSVSVLRELLDETPDAVSV